MKVELDDEIVDYITLQGLKSLKKFYKEEKENSYKTPIPIWDTENRDREYVMNDVMLNAIKLVASNLERDRDTDKLFYELAKSCAKLGETYK